MNGRQIGSLNILSIEQDGTVSKLWSRSGNQGNVWKKASVNIDTGPDLQVGLHRKMVIVNIDTGLDLQVVI